jgi:hypothetical protein
VKRALSAPYASQQFGRAGHLKVVWPTGNELYAIKDDRKDRPGKIGVRWITWHRIS